MEHNTGLEKQPGMVVLQGCTDVQDTGYGESVDIIRMELKNIEGSFVRIGWHLKRIKDNGWYKSEGYKNIYEFAKGKFNISQSTATRCINICVEFSKDGGSPELDAGYQGYSLSQLTEMLNMDPDKRQEITPDMKVREIKRKEKAGKELQKYGAGEPSSQIMQAGFYATPHKEGETGMQAALPGIKNDVECREWLENAEDWGLWYVDRNICAAYYKYDFPDGSRLVAVEYGYGKDLGTGSRNFIYHMIFSDCYRKKHMEPGDSLSCPGYYTEQTVEIGILLEFLKELQEERSTDAGTVEDSTGYISNGYIINEFDPDHLEKEDNEDKKYATRRYAEFYKENNYIPKYFNAKDKKEVTDYVPTLTTSSNSCTGLGSVIVFDAWKEIEKIDAELVRGDITWEEAEKTVCKIWRIAKQKEREKIKKLYKQDIP